MFSLHGLGRLHITSSGREWTCLLWLVQRIANLLPLDPLTPVSIPTIRISALFKRIPVTGSCRRCHRQLVWDHVSFNHHESRTLPQENYWESDTEIWKGKDTSLHAGLWAQLMRSVSVYSVTHWIKERKKTKSDADLEPAGTPKCFVCFFSYSWQREHPLKTTGSRRLMTLSLSLFAETHLYAQLQFMSKERCCN